jgi:hypothetical protein
LILLILCFFINFGWTEFLNITISENENLLLENNFKKVNCLRYKTNKFIPIKYWNEEQKHNEKIKNQTNINLRYSTNHISSFTTFYDQLDSSIEKVIYNGIYSGSSKTIPDFKITVTLISTQDPDIFYDAIDTYNERVFTTLIYEHPELWWLGAYSLDILAYKYGSKYYYETTYNVLPSISRFQNYSGTQVSKLSKRINFIKNDIKQKISTLGLTSDYAILRYIHDYLIAKITYYLDENKKHIRNVYGALVENKCVCEGYSESLQLIAKDYGIDVIIARSKEHEWNFAKIKNKWYVIDVTWDDPTIKGKDPPSGSYSNLYTSFFLIGTSNPNYTENESIVEHALIYSAYSVTNKLIKYPIIQSNDYSPTIQEKFEVNSIKFNTSYISSELVIGNCRINVKNNEVTCPSTSGHLCISGDNEIYKSEGSSCRKTYTNSSKKYVIALKTDNGFKEYSYDNITITNTTSFIIYGCGEDSISTGCMIYTDNEYIDTINQHIYYLDRNYQYKQIRSSIYKDTINNKTYLCNSSGLCFNSFNQGYYLAGSQASDGSYNKLIKCSTTSCGSATIPRVDGFYINAINGKTLIKCEQTKLTPKCTVTISSLNIKTNGYAYLDAGNIKSTSKSYAGIITCTTSICLSISKPSIKAIQYYLNGNISEDKNIIQCNEIECKSFTASPKKGCAIMDSSTSGNVFIGNGNKFISTPSEASSTTNKYYIDAIDNKQIVTCTYNSNYGKVICVHGSNGTNTDSSVHYVDAGISGNIIECTTLICTSKAGVVGYYISGNSNYPLIKCTRQSKTSKCENVAKSQVKNNAYYLDGSSTLNNMTYNKVIYCNSNSLCTVLNTANKGYYIEGTTPGQLIVCNGSNYSILNTTKIGYYLDGGSTIDGMNYTQIINCTSKTSCTITKEVNTGYYLDGTSTKDNLLYSKLIVYDGNYYFSLARINTGYYLNGNSNFDNKDNKNLIYCASSSKCSSIKTTSNSYFINSGFDANKKKLIFCNKDDGCYTTSAITGFYVAHNGQGYIQCTSSSTCTYYQPTTTVNYINSGFDKSPNILIKCSKINGCISQTANIGYYMTYINTLLLQCISTSYCFEITPSMNSYKNADSTNYSNSTIKCSLVNNVVTCKVGQ